MGAGDTFIYEGGSPTMSHSVSGHLALQVGDTDKLIRCYSVSVKRASTATDCPKALASTAPDWSGWSQRTSPE